MLQSWLLPIKTGAIVLFIVFSVFHKLPTTGLGLEESTRDEVIITAVYFPRFFRSRGVWKYEMLARVKRDSSESTYEGWEQQT